MARIRTIKPEFPISESVGRLSRDARLLFIQLWTVCDDCGRTRASSRLLASLLYPFDDDAGDLMDRWLGELEREQCVRRYVVNGTTYLEVCKWKQHQKIDKPSPSRIPDFVEDSRTLSNPRASSVPDLVPRTVVPSTEDLGPQELELKSSRPPDGERVDTAKRKHKSSQRKDPKPNSRHVPFRTAFAKYFEDKNPGIKAPWDAQEATQLARFLTKYPQFTVEQWDAVLTNRSRSPVQHGLALSAWIAKAVCWASGPTDAFDKPVKAGGFNGKPSRIDEIGRSNQAALELLGRMDSPTYLGGGGTQARLSTGPFQQSSHGPALVSNG